MQSDRKPAELQHDEKMPLKDRIEESQAYGEQYRSDHAGPDQREAVKPLREDKKIEIDRQKTSTVGVP